MSLHNTFEGVQAFWFQDSPLLGESNGTLVTPQTFCAAGTPGTRLMFSAVLVSVAVVLAAADCGPWIAISPQSVPLSQANDTIVVYYLMAPLEECTEGSKFGEIGINHGAIAFKNLRTGDSITVNMDASPTFNGAIAPSILYLAGHPQMVSHNGAGVFIYNGINESYWTSGLVELMTIPGSLYNSFLSQWLADSNSTYTKYNLFRIEDRRTGAIYANETDCFAFVWDVLQVFANCGYVTEAQIKRTWISLYTLQPPATVGGILSNSSERAAAWYQDIEADLNDGLFGYFKAFYEVVSRGIAYTLHDAHVLEVPVVFPWLEWHFQNIPTPIAATTRCSLL